jgi:hypothetical protein
MISSLYKFVSVQGHGIRYPAVSPSSLSCLPLPLDKSARRERELSQVACDLQSAHLVERLDNSGVYTLQNIQMPAEVTTTVSSRMYMSKTQSKHM